jgi:hypothetical protein
VVVRQVCHIIDWLLLWHNTSMKCNLSVVAWKNVTCLPPGSWHTSVLLTGYLTRLLVGVWLAGLSDRLVRRRVQREGRLVSIIVCGAKAADSSKKGSWR